MIGCIGNILTRKRRGENVFGNVRCGAHARKRRKRQREKEIAAGSSLLELPLSSEEGNSPPPFPPLFSLSLAQYRKEEGAFRGERRGRRRGKEAVPHEKGRKSRKDRYYPDRFPGKYLLHSCLTPWPLCSLTARSPQNEAKSVKWKVASELTTCNVAFPTRLLLFVFFSAHKLKPVTDI